MKDKRKRYSASFKAGAVALVKQQGRSVGQAARELGVSESAFRRWLVADAVASGTKEGLTSAEKAEIRELKRELQTVQMERDILKNSRARGRASCWPGTPGRVA
jgi:transposase